MGLGQIQDAGHRSGIVYDIVYDSLSRAWTPGPAAPHGDRLELLRTLPREPVPEVPGIC